MTSTSLAGLAIFALGFAALVGLVLMIAEADLRDATESSDRLREEKRQLQRDNRRLREERDAALTSAWEAQHSELFPSSPPLAPLPMPADIDAVEAAAWKDIVAHFGEER